jgi:uncharacterized protein
MIRVGLISDTHGLLRPDALAFLRGCDYIVHAGDICDCDVLASLQKLAPVTAVRGNNDRGSWAEALPQQAVLRLGELQILAIHDRQELDERSLAKEARVVVFGHSHKPFIERQRDVLFINPGSAGPRRFGLPISVGEVLVDGSQVQARTVELGRP